MRPQKMVINNLCKAVEFYRKQLDRIESIANNNNQFELLKNLPFYNWDNPSDIKTFNNFTGLPKKNGKEYPLFEYEQ